MIYETHMAAVVALYLVAPAFHLLWCLLVAKDSVVSDVFTPIFGCLQISHTVLFASLLLALLPTCMQTSLGWTRPGCRCGV
jgi:hypothetical protein